MSTSERWQRVEALYHSALQQPPGERATFLRDACGDDEALRRDVESLLAQPASDAGFLQIPAIAVAARDLATGSGALLAVGYRVGPYTILGLLGVGGMGEVYRAHDTTLGRDIAIKVLPPQSLADPERRARFEREARVLATLNHPHIGAIYGTEAVDGGRALVLELVEGETLAERLATGRPLAIADALTIAGQFADALEAAHEKAIVHRDLKPANIKITPEGTVKILDFGLAKLGARGEDGASVRAEGGGPAPGEKGWESPTNVPASQSTKHGVLLGTAAYMSPEQARGLAVDKRTDIWAFGCVLYEMLTGAAPFGGVTVTDTLAAIIEREPDWTRLSATTPESVAKLLRRCLEKDPKRRLRDIADARIEIQDLVAAPDPLRHRGVRRMPQASPSVAVLPFTNMSADADSQYFSDGLAEDLINALSQLPGLRVASRTSAFRFRGADLDIRRMGSELSVAAIVEGSVRRSGNRLRVTAQLINVVDGHQLWSERYNRELVNIFDIQDEIVASIVKALAPALLGETKDLVRRPTDNLEAYEFYLKGRHYLNERSPGTLRLAIQCFEQAIAADSAYTLAYCGLADCHGVLRAYGLVSAESRPLAEAAISRAMDLDPELAETSFSRAFYTFYFEASWRRAEMHFRHSLTKNPRWSLAHVYFSLYLAIDYRVEEAVAHADSARDLDPLSPFIHSLAALTLYECGRYREAEHASRRALELQADYLVAVWVRAFALYGLGETDAGVAAMRQVVARTRAPAFVGVLGFGCARAGRIEEARQLLHELEDRQRSGEYVAPFALLPIHVGLEDVEGVRATLARCLAESSPVAPVRNTALFLENLRRDPEIDRLLDRLNDGSRPR
jgi:serine/threonine-protein kinase